MNKLVNRSRTFLKRNGSTILTCVGGAGVIATTVLAVKATPKALALLEEAKEEKGDDLTALETVAVAGPVYIPAAITGVSTLACIFGANILNKRQQAGLMSAYALLDSSYKEYKNKVGELYGEEADLRVREEIAKDMYEEDTEFDDGLELFFDNYSMRYFRTTAEKVQRAEYEINRTLNMRDWASLNEFYEFLGIPGVEGGEEVGWSIGGNLACYWQSWIDFDHDKVPMEDGMECYIINSPFDPPSEYF